jgi:phage gp37-like protein
MGERRRRKRNGAHWVLQVLAEVLHCEVNAMSEVALSEKTRGTHRGENGSTRRGRNGGTCGGCIDEVAKQRESAGCP